jgi:CheY-like chemotaxis protein
VLNVRRAPISLPQKAVVAAQPHPILRRTKVAPDKLISGDRVLEMELISYAGTDVAAFRVIMDAPLRILAVDNEPSVTLSLRFVFAGPRYEVTCVDSGHAALAKLDVRSDFYDVIIVDQKMPNLTGVKLVEEIRKRGITSDIIVVAANLSPEVREAFEQMDVHAMFMKPFNVDELRSAVDRLATASPSNRGRGDTD